jgi:hypothetical protein
MRVRMGVWNRLRLRWSREIHRRRPVATARWQKHRCRTRAERRTLLRLWVWEILQIKLTTIELWAAIRSMRRRAGDE